MAEYDWRNLIATPEERRRGEALAHALEYVRRANSALQAAYEGEANSYRQSQLRAVGDELFALQRALRLLS